MKTVPILPNSLCLLHRPAAWIILSKPALDLTTHPNEKFTPASTTCVLTHIIFFDCSFKICFIDFNVSNLCCGHILLLKWKSSYSCGHIAFNCWNVFIAQAVVFKITNVLWYCSVFSFTNSLKSSISIPPGYNSVASLISVLLKAFAYFSGLPAISIHSQMLFSFIGANVGCVAEHNTTVVPQNWVRKFTAKLKSSIHFTGIACTSSNMIILLHNVCILRIQLFWAENNVFNICTAVVTIIGESQVSVSLRYWSSSPSSQTTLQWCSNTTSALPIAFRISSAFWINIELNGAI